MHNFCYNCKNRNKCRKSVGELCGRNEQLGQREYGSLEKLVEFEESTIDIAPNFKIVFAIDFRLSS